MYLLHNTGIKLCSIFWRQGLHVVELLRTKKWQKVESKMFTRASNVKIKLDRPVKNNPTTYINVSQPSDKWGRRWTIRITFIRIWDGKGHKFRVEENYISDISFDHILEKIPKPRFNPKTEMFFITFYKVYQSLRYKLFY